MGGQQTEVNEYPWMVGLYYHPWSTQRTYCGGSLISSRWILSAAHCFYDQDTPSNWHAGLGDHDYLITTETDHIDKDIATIINHPNYNDDTFDFDFALLKLDSEVDFSLHPTIRPICLPSDAKDSHTGQAAITTGWGRTQFGGSSSNVLLEVDVSVLSNMACKADYGYDPEEISDQMICANKDGGGKDACQGDSGRESEPHLL